MGSFFLAIDCGTSFVKTAVFTGSGNLKAVSESFYPTLSLSRGRLEQEPALLFELICRLIKKSLKKAKINPLSLEALSLSTQRATFLCAGKNKEPLTNFISWQDMRAKKDFSPKGKAAFKGSYRISGVPDSPVFSLAKVVWIKNQAQAVYNKTSKFLLLHSYLLSKLGCCDYVEDFSNASLTGMFDVKKLCWSKEILKNNRISESKLPGLVASGEIVGFLNKKSAQKTGLKEGMPLVSGGGDKQCAGLGMGVAGEGVAGISLGTAAAVLACTKKNFVDSREKIIYSAHVIKGFRQVEGLQSSAGASLAWLNKITSKKNLNALLSKQSFLKSREGKIIFYPYLSGAFCPHWNEKARGAFLGLSLDTEIADLFLAVMQGISFEAREISDLLFKSGLKIKEFRVAGGGAKFGFWSQMQADIFQKKIFKLKNQQASLAGAAMLAVFGLGRQSFKKIAAAFAKPDKVFLPDKTKKAAYDRAYRAYAATYKRLLKANVF